MTGYLDTILVPHFRKFFKPLTFITHVEKIHYPPPYIYSGLIFNSLVFAFLSLFLLTTTSLSAQEVFISEIYFHPNNFFVQLEEQQSQAAGTTNDAWQQTISTTSNPAVVRFKNLPVGGGALKLSADMMSVGEVCEDQLSVGLSAPNTCPCQVDTIVYEQLLNGNLYDLKTKVHFFADGPARLRLNLSNGLSQERLVDFSPATFLFEEMICTGTPMTIETYILEGDCGDQVGAKTVVLREPLNCDGGLDEEVYCPEDCPIRIGEDYRITMTQEQIQEQISRCDDTENIKLCYQWKLGDDIIETDDICTPSLEVCPEKTETYIRVVTDNCGYILAEEEYTIEIHRMEVNITPNPIGLCPEESVELDAGKFYESYLWSTGADTRKITINSPGLYSVTVTSEQGCKASAEITVTDYQAPNAIKDLLEGEGFMCIPIAIDPDGFTSNPVISRNFIEDISEDIRFSIAEGEGFISSQELGTWLDEFLASSDSYSCATSKRGLISSNSNFCSSDYPPNLLDHQNELFEGIDLGYWFHIWEGEDNEGCLFVRVITPAQETYSPESEQMDFINELLTSIANDSDTYGFSSKQEQMMNTLFGLTLNNYVDTIPIALDNTIVDAIYPELGAFLPLSTACTATDEASIGIAPSALPVWIPAGTSPAYGVNPAYNQVIDERALTRFTIYEGEHKGLHRAAIKAGCLTQNEQIFLGYYNINKSDYYTFSTSNVSENPIEVQYGVKESLPCPDTYFNIFTGDYTYSGTPNEKAEGNLVAEFNDPILAEEPDIYTIYTCAAEIAEYAVNHPIAFDLNPSNHPSGISDGWELHVKNATGGITRLYVRFEANVDIPTYYEWNPCSVNWELLDASVPTEQMHFLNVLVQVAKDNVHTGLDIVGLIPVLGEIADVANAIIYTIEGNYVDASISAVSATTAAGWVVLYRTNKIVIKDEAGRVISTLPKVFKNSSTTSHILAHNFLQKLRDNGLSQTEANTLFKWLWRDENIEILKKFNSPPPERDYISAWKALQVNGHQVYEPVWKNNDNLDFMADYLFRVPSDFTTVKNGLLGATIKQNWVDLFRIEDKIKTQGLTNKGIVSLTKLNSISWAKDYAEQLLGRLNLIKNDNGITSSSLRKWDKIEAKNNVSGEVAIVANEADFVKNEHTLIIDIRYLDNVNSFGALNQKILDNRTITHPNGVIEVQYVAENFTQALFHELGHRLTPKLSDTALEDFTNMNVASSIHYDPELYQELSALSSGAVSSNLYEALAEIFTSYKKNADSISEDLKEYFSAYIEEFDMD